MVSSSARAHVVTVNDVPDGHVALDLQCLGPALPAWVSQPASGRRAGDPGPAAPQLPSSVPGVPAADRGRVPPPGGHTVKASGSAKCSTAKRRTGRIAAP